MSKDGVFVDLHALAQLECGAPESNQAPWNTIPKPESTRQVPLVLSSSEGHHPSLEDMLEPTVAVGVSGVTAAQERIRAQELSALIRRRTRMRAALEPEGERPQREHLVAKSAAHLRSHFLFAGVRFATVFLISFGFSFFHEIQRGYPWRTKIESAQLEKTTNSSGVVSDAPIGAGVNAAAGDGRSRSEIEPSPKKPCPRSESSMRLGLTLLQIAKQSSDPRIASIYTVPVNHP